MCEPMPNSSLFSSNGQVLQKMLNERVQIGQLDGVQKKLLYVEHDQHVAAACYDLV